MWAQKYKNPHIYATNPQEKECLCIKKSYKRLRKRKNMHFNLHHNPPKVVRVPQILRKKHSKVYLTTCNIYLTACNIYFTTRNIYFTSCNIVFKHCRELYEANERLCKASAEDFGVRIKTEFPVVLPQTRTGCFRRGSILLLYILLNVCLRSRRLIACV